MFKASASVSSILNALEIMDDEHLDTAIDSVFKYANKPNELMALTQMNLQNVKFPRQIDIRAARELCHSESGVTEQVVSEFDPKIKVLYTHQAVKASKEFSSHLKDFFIPFLNRYEDDAKAGQSIEPYLRALGEFQAAGYACNQEDLVQECEDRIVRLRNESKVSGDWYPHAYCMYDGVDEEIPSCFYAFINGNLELANGIDEKNILKRLVTDSADIDPVQILEIISRNSNYFHVKLKPESMEKLSKIVANEISDNRDYQTYLIDFAADCIPHLSKATPHILKGMEFEILQLGIAHACDHQHFPITKEMLEIEEVYTQEIDTTRRCPIPGGAIDLVLMRNINKNFNIHNDIDRSLEFILKEAGRHGVLNEVLEADAHQKIRISLKNFMVNGGLLQSTCTAMEAGLDAAEVHAMVEKNLQEGLNSAVQRDPDTVKSLQQIVQISRSYMAKSAADDVLLEMGAMRP